MCLFGFYCGCLVQQAGHFTHTHTSQLGFIANNCFTILGEYYICPPSNSPHVAIVIYFNVLTPFGGVALCLFVAKKSTSECLRIFFHEMSPHLRGGSAGTVASGRPYEINEILRDKKKIAGALPNTFRVNLSAKQRFTLCSLWQSTKKCVQWANFGTLS